MSSYSIISEIGHGGMGCVYKAKDSSGRVVALKMMSNRVTCHPEYRELFKSEVETLRQMNHPSVVHIVGEPYTDSAGNFFLPMEFIEGETIKQHVEKYGVFTLDEAMNLMMKILEALQYVHDRHRIHRDIKPSNIMIRPNGSICVIDFGIAKDAKIGVTGHTTGRIIGTDGYMSPEQANGLNIDHRTDIYSLGCVFYYILTGQQAVKIGKNDNATVANILHGEMPLPSHANPTIPAAVDEVYLRSVDKNMLKRYQSAYEFKEALEGVLGSPNPRITVGSSSDNDIRINNPYVSRHHLVIKGIEQPMTAGAKKYAIEITDKSTNGTGVNGRPLWNKTMVVEYDGTLNLPEVLLAAREDCPLQWNEVVSKLKLRGWTPDPVISSPSSPPPQHLTPPHTPSSDEKLGAFLGIISFLFPIVGWILWGVWKNEYPEKARQASILAWIGFGINFIMTIINLLNV